MSAIRTGGPARIDPSCFVAPGAVVVGDVTLAPRSSVWFNSVVRGDSAEVQIGEDSNVQDSSVVHQDEGYPALIGARVTIGHRAIIHGCVIEDDCLIGMGSILLTGARIGSGSLIGAGALVREGQVIPPGTLAVGAPARVAGPVSDAHRASIQNGWSHYAQLARGYLEQGIARSLDRTGAAMFDRAPMDLREWSDCVRVMRGFPERLLAARGAPGQDSGLADAIIGLLMARDRFRRHPVLADLDAHGRAALDPDPGRPHQAAEGDLHHQWSAVREALCAALERTGPRPGWQVDHASRGPFTLPELVREWIEEDFEQARRLAAPGVRS